MALNACGTSPGTPLRCVRVCMFTGYATWEIDFYTRIGFNGFNGPHAQKICVKGEKEQYEFFIPFIYKTTKESDCMLSLEEIQWCSARREAFRLIKEDGASIDQETLHIDLKNGTILENKSEPHAIFLLSLWRGCLFCEECQKMMKEKTQNNKR